MAFYVCLVTYYDVLMTCCWFMMMLIRLLRFCFRFRMMFVWVYVDVLVISNNLIMLSWLFLWFVYDALWFSFCCCDFLMIAYDFLMMFLRFSYDVPMSFLGFTQISHVCRMISWHVLMISHDLRIAVSYDFRMLSYELLWFLMNFFEYKFFFWKY